MDEEQMLELCKNLGFGQNCYAVSTSRSGLVVVVYYYCGFKFGP